jgi:lytic murein transglycosylase
MRIAVLAGLVALLGATPPAVARDFAACVAGLRAAAVRVGVDRSIAARALAIGAPDKVVLRLVTTQPEAKHHIWDYLAYLVDDRRIADGRAMLRKYGRVLRAVERRFGVDRHVVVALWGVETDYGRRTGGYFLPHALATLACGDPRRARLWRRELIAALRLVDRGDLKLDELRGSWAGAFGQTQFMPTTYLRAAVDFDRDGRRDLIKSVADALASAANYLRRAGWRPGRPWMIEVRVPAGYRGPTGRRRKAALSTWARRGVVRADGRTLAGALRAGLILPAGAKGPGFLAFRNFDALYAYNHAISYALAIAHLADRLAGRPAFRTRWPTDDPGLSRAERRELQRRLVARGHDVGTVDGRVGPLTRAAIAAEEKRLGMTPTGRPGRRIYRALGGR